MRYLRRGCLEGWSAARRCFRRADGEASAAARLGRQAGTSIENLGNLKRGSNMPFSQNRHPPDAIR